MLDIKVINKNADGSFRVEPCGCENNITVYDVRFCARKMCSPEKITVEFNIPYVGAFSVWNSGCGLVRNILPDWRPEHQVASCVRDTYTICYFTGRQQCVYIVGYRRKNAD